MRLTILGSSPASTNPGGASSSYLVQQGATTLVLDCGSGSFGNLIKHVAAEQVDAVVISHMHADHMLDLLPYHYALVFASQQAGEEAPIRRPALYFPPGGHARALAVSHLQDDGDGFYADYFRVAEYDPLAELLVGELTLRFVPVLHIDHTYAVRVSGAGRTLAFSADTGPCPGLAEAARGADLFLCECSNPRGSGFPYHLTATQAGVAAREGGVGRLVLTHRWYRSGLEQAVEEARTAFGGPVDLAREGAVWEV